MGVSEVSRNRSRLDRDTLIEQSVTLIKEVVNKDF